MSERLIVLQKQLLLHRNNFESNCSKSFCHFVAQINVSLSTKRTLFCTLEVENRIINLLTQTQNPSQSPICYIPYKKKKYAKEEKV